MAPEIHEIGGATVEVGPQCVVATLARNTTAHPPGFIRGVHALQGTWIGNRIRFAPEQSRAVLDLFLTHYGMELDPLGLGPPLGYSGLGTQEPTELQRAQAQLAVVLERLGMLDRRSSILRDARDRLLDRIAMLAGRS